MTPLRIKTSILLAIVMIVPYLTRIVLLLPELSSTQTDQLADIIEQQKFIDNGKFFFFVLLNHSINSVFEFLI